MTLGIKINYEWETLYSSEENIGEIIPGGIYSIHLINDIIMDIKIDMYY